MEAEHISEGMVLTLVEWTCDRVVVYCFLDLLTMRAARTLRSTFVLDHLVPQELGRPLGDAYRSRLLSFILRQRLGHAAVLGNELNELLVRQRLSLTKENIKPLVRNLRNCGVTFLRRGS
jgi:hypothetical protein